MLSIFYCLDKKQEEQPNGTMNGQTNGHSAAKEESDIKISSTTTTSQLEQHQLPNGKSEQMMDVELDTKPVELNSKPIESSKISSRDNCSNNAAVPMEQDDIVDNNKDNEKTELTRSGNDSVLQKDEIMSDQRNRNSDKAVENNTVVTKATTTTETEQKLNNENNSSNGNSEEEEEEDDDDDEESEEEIIEESEEEIVLSEDEEIDDSKLTS